MQILIDDEKLLSLEEKIESLYNKFAVGYKLAISIGAKWIQIYQELGAPEEQCRSRWTSLRERCGRMCRRLDVPFGSGASSIELWPHFEAMHLLRNQLKPRRTWCNTNVCNDLARSPSPNLSDSLFASQLNCSSSSSLSPSLAQQLFSQPPKSPPSLPSTFISSRPPSPLPPPENHAWETSPTPSIPVSGNIRKPGEKKEILAKH